MLNYKIRNRNNVSSKSQEIFRDLKTVIIKSIANSNTDINLEKIIIPILKKYAQPFSVGISYVPSVTGNFNHAYMKILLHYELFDDIRSMVIDDIKSNKFDLSQKTLHHIKHLVSIFFHEKFHGIQLSKAKNLRSENNYRSYVQKNRECFLKAIRKEIWGENTAYWYFASPEEIGAYAQQVASEYINSELLDMSPQDQINHIDMFHFKHEIITTYRDMFINSDHRWVYHRFLKKIYAAIICYREQQCHIIATRF